MELLPSTATINFNMTLYDRNMIRFATHLKETAIWLYCWMHDRGISLAGVFGILLGVLTLAVMPKGEPCTCEEQLDPEWVTAQQHQRETDYQAFLEARGTLPLCAAQWLQLNKNSTKINPRINH